MLSNIKESEGNTTEASNLLQELQVETFGSMERKEKVDFILEQMRLLRLQKDWEKLAIVAKRINIKWLSEKDHEVTLLLPSNEVSAKLTLVPPRAQEMKLRYYDLMIQWGLHEQKYLDVCKFYRSVLDTPLVADDEQRWPSVLRNVVLFVILAPYDNEQSDLLQRVFQDERLSKLSDEPSAAAYDLLKCFTTPELMRWPGIEALHGPALRKTRVFAASSQAKTSSSSTEVSGDVPKDDDPEASERRWQVLHDRVVEHNIRTVATYYTRITLARLAALLDLGVDATERHLSKLVVDKTVYAKIDTIDKLVSFVRPKSSEQVLNEWSSDVSKLMGLIEKSTHLIAKEHAVHAALKTAATNKA